VNRTRDINLHGIHWGFSNGFSRSPTFFWIGYVTRRYRDTSWNYSPGPQDAIVTNMKVCLLGFPIPKMVQKPEKVTGILVFGSSSKRYVEMC